MSSKRRSKKWKKRSLASKKGWETRRKKQELEKEVVNVKTKLRNTKKGASKKTIKLAKKELPKLPKRSKKGKSKAKQRVEELEDRIRLSNAEIEILQLTKDWVHAMPVEYLHRDGTIALQPSVARHLGKMTDIAIEQLDKAFEAGSVVFDRVAQHIAGILNVSLREIYTLHYSP